MTGPISSRARASYWPFVRAEQQLDCDLFWIGVPAFPIPSPHRAWLTDFIARFNSAVENELGIRGEFFLELKTIIEVERRFRRLALELAPWPGFSRRPGTRPPAPPSKRQMEAILDGQAYDVRDFFPDSCYWLRAEVGKLMIEFFGLGGTSMFYLPPDPAAAPAKIPYLHELKQTFPNIQFDKLEHIVRVTSSLREPFLAKSKELFGEGLEDDPAWEGISFILPFLETRDFFTQPAAEKQKWFELFDVFWRESPPDGGLYIASKRPIDATIVSVLQSMTEAGHLHPDDEART